VTALRRAHPDDAGAIAEVHVRAWKGAYPGLLPQDYLDALHPEDRVGMWAEALGTSPWPVVLVAEDEGLVRGFCSFGPSQDGDADPAVVGELYTIYVDPDAWGEGLGRALLEAATAGLTEAGFAEATLWVLGVNEAARGFYDHAGWHHDGTTKERNWTAFVAMDARYRRRLI